MSAAQMEEIKKQFAAKVHQDKLDESKSLKELGLDSLDVVELCLDLEDKYGIQFETAELAGFKTVGDLLHAIETKLNAK
jgi:acyl carrier protein